MDVCANLRVEDRAGGLLVASGERVLVPSGFALAIPPGFEVQMRPRSGLALRNGLTLLNAPGTIDSDYRGEVGVILINHGTTGFTVEHGMRVAQMVLAPVLKMRLDPVETLGATDRGEGGFGSTGTAGNSGGMAHPC
jgi:dUTP pyrophosphatase